MLLSATAVRPEVAYAPPTDVVTDPSAAEAWMAALPPVVRQRLQVRLLSIYRGMPVAAQLAVQRSIIARGGIPKVTPVLDGLGDFNWGTTLVTLASVSAQVFNAASAGRLQKDIAEGAQSTSAQIAQAQIEASQQAQLALIDAQKQAVALKAQQTAQTSATMREYLPYILGGAGALALVFVVIKARSKRTP
jgi:hypothetical protein